MRESKKNLPNAPMPTLLSEKSKLDLSLAHFTGSYSKLPQLTCCDDILAVRESKKDLPHALLWQLIQAATAYLL